jgi:hypothetical protein
LPVYPGVGVYATSAEQFFGVVPKHVTEPMLPRDPCEGGDALANVNEFPSTSLPVSVIVLGMSWVTVTACAVAVGAELIARAYVPKLLANWVGAVSPAYVALREWLPVPSAVGVYVTAQVLSAAAAAGVRLQASGVNVPVPPVTEKFTVPVGCNAVTATGGVLVSNPVSWTVMVHVPVA